MTTEIKFGDIYRRKYGIGMDIVLLHVNRFGDMTFGTENGGDIYMTTEQFNKDLASGKIEKRGEK